MKRNSLYLTVIAFLCCSLYSYAQSIASKIKAFKTGEVLEYEVFYSWGLIWANAGQVTFSVKEEIVKDKTLYHFIGEGSSKKNWDWFFKVRDKFESYNDSANLHPYKYVRNTNDGGDWVYNDITFDQKNNRAVGFLKTKKKPELKIDTVRINYLTFDPISMIYYARTIDYEKFKVNDEIPITIILDNIVYYRKIVYLGKENIKTELGIFKCIKFKPTLIPGTIFKEGDAMTVWVSDDDNRLPIKVETPIIIGTVKVYLSKYSGVKHKLISKTQ